MGSIGGEAKIGIKAFREWKIKTRVGFNKKFQMRNSIKLNHFAVHNYKNLIFSKKS
jgi:hypothetical protein